MNKEERVKLVFNTISNLAGFEVKPDKPFYMTMQGDKHTFKLDEESNLYLYDNIKDYFYWRRFNFSSLFRDDWKFEEIKEPLLTKEEKNS